MELFTVSTSSNTIVEEIPNRSKSSLIPNEPNTELLISKKVCSKRKNVGKKIAISKEFVIDDSSSESDSDSAEERLVIVNDDESTNDSNRSQKNTVIGSEEDKKLVPTETKFKKVEESKEIINSEPSTTPLKVKI